MTDRDIVDDIDRLVDEQMANYSNRSGYDRNVNQAKCPQPYCDADWHGLPIKQRMRRMRDLGHVDPTYVYAEDDSPVICPGSLFEGEFTPPKQSTTYPTGDRGWTASDIERLRRSYQDQMFEGVAEQLRAINAWPNPFSSSDEPLRDVIVAYSRREAERYARSRNIRNPIYVTRRDSPRGLLLDRHRLHMLDPDPDVIQQLSIRTRYGRPIESFYAAIYPGVLTDEQRRRLGSLYAVFAAPYGVDVMSEREREYIEDSMIEGCIRAAEDEFWAGVVDRNDIIVYLEPAVNTPCQGQFSRFIARWEPRNTANTFGEQAA